MELVNFSISNNYHSRCLVSDDREGLKLLGQHGLQIANNIRQIGKRLDFEVPTRLAGATLIGNCSVGSFSYIGSGSEIRNTSIGRFCSIAANVALGPAEHPTTWLSSHPFQFDGVRYFDAHQDWRSFSSNEERFTGNSAVTTIGNDVWIGRNAIIRQGINVGDGAVIAGGAFVNKDVPPYSIVGGTPARLIRYRFTPLLIQKLVSLKWWTWVLEPSLNQIKLSNIDASIDKITELIETKKILPFKPKILRLQKSDGQYELIQFSGN